MSFTLRRFVLRLFRENGRRRCNFTDFCKTSILENPCMAATTNTKLTSPFFNVRWFHSAVQSNPVSMKDESREMMAIWPDIVRDITEPSRHELPEVAKWLAKVLQYNVPTGKKIRGLSIVYAYRILAQSHELTEENLRLARILGWCAELCQAFLLIEDDVMDHSQIRRGQKCWYLHKDVGLSAINDGILLDQAVYKILKKYFRGKPCYVNLIESFHDNTFKTVMGQTLDLLSTGYNREPNFDLFTMDRYNAIVKHKSAYYTFVMPIAAAMHFAGITDPEVHRQAKTILFEMGHYFQVQDDYLDCYGELKHTGKVGTDIQEGKCTWLAVVALQRATPSQRKIFNECYGVNDSEKIMRIKELYNDLGLATTYLIYEEESHNLINTHIQQISRGLPHELFFTLLSKIYHRNA